MDRKVSATMRIDIIPDKDSIYTSDYLDNLLHEALVIKHNFNLSPKQLHDLYVKLLESQSKEEE